MCSVMWTTNNTKPPADTRRVYLRSLLAPQAGTRLTDATRWCRGTWTVWTLVFFDFAGFPFCLFQLLSDRSQLVFSPTAWTSHSQATCSNKRQTPRVDEPRSSGRCVHHNFYVLLRFEQSFLYFLTSLRSSFLRGLTEITQQDSLHRRTGAGIGDRGQEAISKDRSLPAAVSCRSRAQNHLKPRGSAFTHCSGGRHRRCSQLLAIRGTGLSLCSLLFLLPRRYAKFSFFSSPAMNFMYLLGQIARQRSATQEREVERKYRRG